MAIFSLSPMLEEGQKRLGYVGDGEGFAQRKTPLFFSNVYIPVMGRA